MTSRDQVQQDQQKKLRALLRVLRKSNRFFQNRFEKARSEPPRNGAGLAEILDGIELLTKEDLVADQQTQAPHGTNLSYPPERYVRLHQTSGTSGKPLIWLDTAESWQWFLDGWADIYRRIGVTSEDRAFFAFSFGPFIGFWAAFEACRQLDVMALPGGALTTDQRLDAIIQHEATVLVCTPTYALRLAERAAERGIDLASSSIRLTLHAGEPGASIPSVRARLEAAWGAECRDHAGATEIGPWGVPANDDFMYVNEAQFIAELIDPATGQRLEPREGGQRGELVLTNLGRHGSPVLRYRTGDLVDMWPADETGFVRLKGGVLARADDMVVVRGVNVYPRAIEALVRDFEAAQGLSIDEYRVDIRRSAEMVELEMQIETPAERAEEVARRLAEQLRSQLSLRVPVRVVPHETLPRFELKAKRFFVQDH